MTKVDPSLAQIVRRHFHSDTIAGKDTDAVLLHSAGRIGESLVPIVDLYTKSRIREQFLHSTFELDQVFLRQTDLLHKGTGAPKRPRSIFRPILRPGANSPPKRGLADLAQAH